MLINQGYKITDSTWARLIKEDHDSSRAKYDRYSKSLMNKQLEKGQRGAVRPNISHAALAYVARLKGWV